MTLPIYMGCIIFGERDEMKESTGRSYAEYVDRTNKTTVENKTQARYLPALRNNRPETTIKLQRLKWAGPVQRMKESKVVKMIFNQKLEGRRLVGRPGARWADKIREVARYMLEIPN